MCPQEKAEYIKGPEKRTLGLNETAPVQAPDSRDRSFNRLIAHRPYRGTVRDSTFISTYPGIYITKVSTRFRGWHLRMQ